MAATARSLAKRRLLDKLRTLLEVPGARPWDEVEKGLARSLLRMPWEALNSLTYRIENQLSRSYEEGAKSGR